MSEKAMTFSASRPALRLVPGMSEDAPAWSWFCGRCAAVPDHESVSPLARVCPSCGMGLVLETRSDAVPFPADAFLVVASCLTVQALSYRGEQLLDKREEDVIGRPVGHFLGAAEVESGDPEDLVALLHATSTGNDELRSLWVRPHGAFGVRLTARIAPSGPPRAALVVLSRQALRRDLRIVPAGTSAATE
jgi:ribosomal protein S27AE